tara:strand:+ start:1348 stop:1863 length:516 start_codon:yes stop_codon:yes gene_type:complete
MNQQDISNITFFRHNERKSRKHNAVVLPPDMSNIILPKYIVYYCECYNKEKNLWRDFFKIESHPLQKKPIYSSKSNKLTILEKLNQITELLKQLNNNPQDNNIDSIVLPKYISINTKQQPHYLIYDKKTKLERKTYRMNLPKQYSINTYLKIFNDKISQKIISDSTSQPEN